MPQPTARLLSLAAAVVFAVGAVPALAQNYPVSPQQRAVAGDVAQRGVPVSELAPNAPDLYTVKRGDTLWGISGLFLKSPWRWPELWGMNMEAVRNPHRIYPGQVLSLEKADGFARLRIGGGGARGEPATVRVSPRTRSDSTNDAALPMLNPALIEPFLAEPLVVDELTLTQAPRIVAGLEDRVLLARGDRAYVRSEGGAPKIANPPAGDPGYRIFRNAVPLKDPATGVVLGYEAQYLGRADLVRGEAVQSITRDGKTVEETIPATIDIVANKEEMRAGDRLLPEPPRQFPVYAPRLPPATLAEARVVSIYGSAVANAAQNQVVAINKGALDGVEVGHVMAILSEGPRMVDKTDAGRPVIKLPDERNGLLMVFRTFDQVSYALVLEIRMGVKVGDRLVSPR